MSKNLRNIQILCRPELQESFNDIFEQSGTNSKGEFLGMLLESYLNGTEERETLKRDFDSVQHRKAVIEAELNSTLESKKGSMIIRVNDKQKQLLERIFNEAAEYNELILPMLDAKLSNIDNLPLQALVLFATTYTKKRSGFFVDTYERLFHQKGIFLEEMVEAFPFLQDDVDELDEIEIKM